MPFGYVYRKRVARRIKLKRELRHILSQIEGTNTNMHADETKTERESLKKTINEAQQLHKRLRGS